MPVFEMFCLENKIKFSKQYLKSELLEIFMKKTLHSLWYSLKTFYTEYHS